MGFVSSTSACRWPCSCIGFVFIPLYYKWKVYGCTSSSAKRLMGASPAHRRALPGAAQPGRGHHHLRAQHHPQQGAALAAPRTCVFIGALVILYTTTGGACRGRYAQAADGRDVPGHLHRLRPHRALPGEHVLRQPGPGRGPGQDEHRGHLLGPLHEVHALERAAGRLLPAALPTSAPTRARCSFHRRTENVAQASGRGSG